MTTPIDSASVLTISAGYRLQFEESQDKWVLLYPEGMVKLNPSAAEILKRCDGQRSLAEVIRQLEEEFQQTGLESDVLSFAQIALEQKWIKLANG